MGASTQLNEAQGINAERIAKELYDAMDGPGTKEDKFFTAIQPVGRKGLTPEEQKQVYVNTIPLLTMLQVFLNRKEISSFC